MDRSLPHAFQSFVLRVADRHHLVYGDDACTAIIAGAIRGSHLKTAAW